MSAFDVIIVGDGFCSLMTAAQLVRSGKNLKIAVAGISADWGPGLAYGRCHKQHLLNVPAAKMSAFPDDPESFVRWLRENISAGVLASFESEDRKWPNVFVPRYLYGDYLRSIAKETLPHVIYMTGEVADIDFKNDLFLVSSAKEKLSSKNLVLATGAKTQPETKMIDPWDFDFSVFKNFSKPVVIMGTGLTMVDVVSSLAVQDFKGKITAVSRRGLLPHTHVKDEGDKIASLAAKFLPLEGTLAQKTRAFRKNARLCTQGGIPWQAYIDYIRPRIPELWQGLSVKEQKKFLARIFPYWNIHRHRQPVQTAVILEKFIKDGQFEIRKGIFEIPKDAKIFNCRGADYKMESDPLLQKLLQKGLLQKNGNDMGVKMNHDLSAGKNLFIAGNLTAGTFLESTAVPELRAQCAKIAHNF